MSVILKLIRFFFLSRALNGAYISYLSYQLTFNPPRFLREFFARKISIIVFDYCLPQKFYISFKQFILTAGE